MKAEYTPRETNDRNKSSLGFLCERSKIKKPTFKRYGCAVRARYRRSLWHNEGLWQKVSVQAQPTSHYIYTAIMYFTWTRQSSSIGAVGVRTIARRLTVFQVIPHWRWYVAIGDSTACTMAFLIIWGRSRVALRMQPLCDRINGNYNFFDKMTRGKKNLTDWFNLFMNNIINKKKPPINTIQLLYHYSNTTHMWTITRQASFTKQRISNLFSVFNLIIGF